MNTKYVTFCRWFAVLVLLQTFMPPGAESKPMPGKKTKMALSALAGLTAGHLIGRATANRPKKEKFDMSEHLPPNCRKEVSTKCDPQDSKKFITIEQIICDPLPNQQPQQQQIVSSQTGSTLQQQQMLYPNLYVPQQQQYLQQQQSQQPQQQHLQQPQPQQQQLQHQHFQQQQPQQQQLQHQHLQQQYPQQPQQQQPQPQQQPQHPDWHHSPPVPQGQPQQLNAQQQLSYHIPIYPQIPMTGSQQPASQQHPSAPQQNQPSIAQQQHPIPCANHSIAQQPQKPVETAPQTVQTVQTPAAAPAPAPSAMERAKPFVAFIKNLQEKVAKRKAEQAARVASADGVKDSYLRIQQAVEQPNPTPQNTTEQVANAAAAQAEQFVQPSLVVPVQPVAPSIQQVQPAVVQQPPPAGFQQPAQPIGFVQPPQQAVQQPSAPAPQTVQVVQPPQQVQSQQPVQPVQSVQIPQTVQTNQAPQYIQTVQQPLQPVQVVQQPQPAQPAPGTSQVFVLSKKTGYFGKSSTDRILQTNLVLMMMMAFLLIWFQ